MFVETRSGFSCEAFLFGPKGPPTSHRHFCALCGSNALALRFASVGAASAAKLLSSALKDLLQVDSSVVGAALAAKLLSLALKDLLQPTIISAHSAVQMPLLFALPL